MNLALKQAHRSLGNTKTNPSVGCVVVKDSCVISSGFTKFGGRPHAEFVALSLKNRKMYNSDLYVTLEPCSHFGKTPPCTSKIIKKKVKNVIFSIKDPDPRSFNKSSKLLTKNGIPSKNGILKSELNFFYRSYLKFKTSKTPFVTAKLAVSKDYFTIDKKNKWITNKFSRGRVHLMRANHDCILTSSSTVLDDNPNLTCRIYGLNHMSPTRIIIDKNLKIKTNSNIAKSSKNYKTFIFYNKENKSKILNLRKLKIKLIKFPLNKYADFDLKNLLLKIKNLGYSRIFLESGLKLTSSFLKENLVDDLHLFISNNNLGRNGKNNIKRYMNLNSFPVKSINKKVNLFGDKLVTYRFF